MYLQEKSLELQEQAARDVDRVTEYANVSSTVMHIAREIISSLYVQAYAIGSCIITMIIIYRYIIFL